MIKLTVISDGTPGGFKLTSSDGQVVANVQSLVTRLTTEPRFLAVTATFFVEDPDFEPAPPKESDGSEL